MGAFNVRDGTYHKDGNILVAKDTINTGIGKVFGVKKGTYKLLFLKSSDGGTGFVCVGLIGKSYHSSDGEVWTEMTGLPVNSFNAVTYGNGRFVCVGWKICYSNDGETWNEASGVIINYECKSITYGNNMFVAVGYRKGSSGIFPSYISTDGINWTASTVYRNTYYFDAMSIAYGNGLFVSVGVNYSYAYGAFYSIDGLTWTPIGGLNTTSTYLGVAYGNGRFVCVGTDGRSYYSTNGINWTVMTGLANNTYYSVTYGNGRFVCVGYYGYSYYSINGTTWTAMNGLTIGTYFAVTYKQGFFICVGGSNNNTYSAISEDGTNWVMNSNAMTANILGLCYSIDGGYDNS